MNPERQPRPTCQPLVDTRFKEMSSLERATESFRYNIFCLEHWLSPRGDMREWLRRNILVGMWLLIPAMLIMPAVGLILWQVMGWLSMLTAIAGKLIVLPLLILLVLLVFRIISALIKR